MRYLRSKRFIHATRTVFWTFWVNTGISRIYGFFFGDGAPKVFALDLHNAVLRDGYSFLIKNNLRFERWSISGTSSQFNEPNLRLKFINSKSWQLLDDQLIERFQERYKYTLDKQYGFLVAHTLSFVRLFHKFQKPILAINSTRYEAPFSFNQSEFKKLNKILQDLTMDSKLRIVSNNVGDRDYLEFFSGIKSDHIPSLCDYIPRRSPKNDDWIILSRNIDLSFEISSFGVNLRSQYEKYPNGYTHEEFSKNFGVVYIPHNISTMRLFELATAGFPVRIPSDKLLMELVDLPGVLSELSWIQVAGKACPDWLRDTPADPEWQSFYSWWLARADWKLLQYFPNVSTFDSFNELTQDIPNIEDPTRRNELLRSEWSRIFSEFTISLPKS
jgi:hypothetical protein